MKNSPHYRNNHYIEDNIQKPYNNRKKFKKNIKRMVGDVTYFLLRLDVMIFDTRN